VQCALVLMMQLGSAGPHAATVASPRGAATVANPHSATAGQETSRRARTCAGKTTPAETHLMQLGSAGRMR
jgi:hypothetical protein